MIVGGCKGPIRNENGTGAGVHIPGDGVITVGRDPSDQAVVPGAPVVGIHPKLADDDGING